MFGDKINEKIRFGYARAAQKLGRQTALYRSSSAIDPLNEDNFIGYLPMVVSQDFTWMKANRPGNAYWLLFIDGRQSTYPLSAQEMDYLVDADNTYFVLSKEYQLPMQAVQCNAMVQVIRPDQSTEAGVQAYSAFTPDSSLLKMDKVPCSILMKAAGEKPPSKLPTDTREPSWVVLMPHLGEIILKTGDVIIDDLERQFVISVVEVTEFGFRLTALQAVN